jgi:small subunit ribosomal protein S16
LLKIRLTRTGKKRQPSFRIVVAEHSNAVKGKYLEIVGHYMPATDPKQLILKKERVEYWISKGAHPSDTVASLLKKEGFANMEKYMEERNKQRQSKSKKKAEGEEKGTVPAKPAEGASGAEDASGEKAEGATESAKPTESAEEKPEKEKSAETAAKDTQPAEGAEEKPEDTKKEDTSTEEESKDK